MDVDPRFGTAEELRTLVARAHDLGMYVLLDVIYNHTGDNWFYDADGVPVSQVPYRHSPPYPVHGWRSAQGASVPRRSRAGTTASGPSRSRTPSGTPRAGSIGRWDPEPWEDPLHPDVEFRRGDFQTLKNLDLARRGPVGDRRRLQALDLVHRL